MIEYILIYKKIAFNIVTTINYAFFAHDKEELTCFSYKNLHHHRECGLSLMLLLPLLKHSTPPTTSLCSHTLLTLHEHSASIDKWQWLPFFFFFFFSCMEEFSDTSLFNLAFQVRHHSVRLLLCCNLLCGHNM